MQFAADENFNGLILKILLSRLPDLEIIRIQDTKMYGAADPELLAWLADKNCVPLTHDVRTIPDFVYQRVRAGLHMPGVIEVNGNAPLNRVIDDLEVLIGAGEPKDFKNLIRYVPL